MGNDDQNRQPVQYNTLREAEDEVLSQPERVKGIVGLCGLESGLERLLKAVMIDDKLVEEQIRKRSFSVKVQLAYALGLIPEAVKRDLGYLAEVRNKFAHHADVKSFAETIIANPCSKLSTARATNGDCLDPREAHALALAKCSLFLASVAAKKERGRLKSQQKRLDSILSEYDKASRCFARNTR